MYDEKDSLITDLRDAAIRAGKSYLNADGPRVSWSITPEGLLLTMRDHASNKETTAILSWTEVQHTRNPGAMMRALEDMAQYALSQMKHKKTNEHT